MPGSELTEILFDDGRILEVYHLDKQPATETEASGSVDREAKRFLCICRTSLSCKRLYHTFSQRQDSGKTLVDN